MTTPRRSFLAAFAAAPVVAMAGAAGAATLPRDDLAAMSQADLLEVGSRNRDAAFAALCSDALHLYARDAIAGRLWEDAEAAADAAAPEFPPALCRETTVFVPHPDDPSFRLRQRAQEQWSPERENGFHLWNLAHAEATRRGVAFTPALEAELRAQYAAWAAARDEARAAYMVRELEQQAEETLDRASAAYWRVAECPAPNAEALLVKLHLRRARCEGDDSEQPMWAALAADLERALRG